jgi:hypothetical protein
MTDRYQAAGINSARPIDGSRGYRRFVAEPLRSPIIGDNGWGRIEVHDMGQFRDVKLWPGGGRTWDWDETGTRHNPGIQPADVEELLKGDPETVVLSRGRELRLRTCEETLQLLKGNDIIVVQEETSVAIAEYNRLAQSGRRVAALIHTTC